MSRQLCKHPIERYCLVKPQIDLLLFSCQTIYTFTWGAQLSVYYNASIFLKKNYTIVLWKRCARCKRACTWESTSTLAVSCRCLIERTNSTVHGLRVLKSRYYHNINATPISVLTVLSFLNRTTSTHTFSYATWCSSPSPFSQSYSSAFNASQLIMRLNPFRILSSIQIHQLPQIRT